MNWKIQPLVFGALISYASLPFSSSQTTDSYNNLPQVTLVDINDNEFLISNTNYLLNTNEVNAHCRKFAPRAIGFNPLTNDEARIMLEVFKKTTLNDGKYWMHSYLKKENVTYSRWWVREIVNENLLETEEINETSCTFAKDEAGIGFQIKKFKHSFGLFEGSCLEKRQFVCRLNASGELKLPIEFVAIRESRTVQNDIQSPDSNIIPSQTIIEDLTLSQISVEEMSPSIHFDILSVYESDNLQSMHLHSTIAPTESQLDHAIMSSTLWENQYLLSDVEPFTFEPRKKTPSSSTNVLATNTTRKNEAPWTTNGPSTKTESTSPSDCPCHCTEVKLLLFENQNVTLEEAMEELTTSIKKNLTLNTASLSSTVRKKTSAYDSRPSSQLTGYVGVFCLTMTFGSVILLDLLQLVHFLTNHD